MAPFDVFWNLIQEIADIKGCFFFMDSGEGREFQTADMEGEDISGWLIPIQEKKMFFAECTPTNGIQKNDYWTQYYCFATWSLRNGKVVIEFQQYN